MAYQGTPCSGAEMPAPAVVASAAETPSRPSARAADDVTAGPANDFTPRGAPVCDAGPREPRRLPWRKAKICIGMTDDEVLNLPGWGRPAKIARTRAPREWREEWSYDTRLGGPRQLYFVNGSLIAVERNFTETLAGPVVKFGFD